jgi:HEAT repeat protein
MPGSGFAQDPASDSLLLVTQALQNPQTAVAAVAALAGSAQRAAIEGLVELVYQPPSAAAALAAITALEGRPQGIVRDALVAALESSQSSVRLAAVESLHRRGAGLVEDLVRLLKGDPSWMVRRAALRALADREDADRWRVLTAGTDPHWRVRHALIQTLLPWGQTEESRQEVGNRLAGSDARVHGVRAYLRWRWSGIEPDVPSAAADDPLQACPFWDWDSAVLARRLKDMGEAGRRQALGFMPLLLGHADERVRAQAAAALRNWGEPAVLTRVVALLEEARGDGAAPTRELLAALDLDRKEATARLLLESNESSAAQLAWALDQIGDAIPFAEVSSKVGRQVMEAASLPPLVRAALARLAGRWEDSQGGNLILCLLGDPEAEVQKDALAALAGRRDVIPDRPVQARLLHAGSPVLRCAAVACFAAQADRATLEQLAADDDARVRVALARAIAQWAITGTDAVLGRMQADAHPLVRAAALTPAAAAQLVCNPADETSWHVRAQVARLAKVPAWQLIPRAPWEPAPTIPASPAPVAPRRREPPCARLLGPQRLPVAPLGVSGHYGLPVEGFVRAVEAGVNLLFWEPNYQTLTEFAGRISSGDRAALHFVGGTFEADARRVRRDAERVLRLLRLERLSIYLLFWVQSWQRVTPDVQDALERLREEGKVAAYGLSTHSRRLAAEAIEAGWNPIMVRHSAAHRGAEHDVLPRAAARGASVITFSNTCYGRLLQPRPGLAPPCGADCYRYTLEQPGVVACWTAPATPELLEENLGALRDPALPVDRRERLLAQGASLYEEETIFRRLVRSR